MAITSAVCNSFKQEILEAEHNFTASTGNTFNLALYDSDATLNKSTTVYTTSAEVASGGGYTTAGEALTNTGVAKSTVTSYTDFSDVSWTSASSSIASTTESARTPSCERQRNSWLNGLVRPINLRRWAR